MFSGDEGRAEALAERDAGVDLDKPEVCRDCEDFEAMNVDCAYVDSEGTYFEQRSCGECHNTRIREIEGSPSVRLVQLLLVNDEQEWVGSPEDKRRRQFTSECIKRTFEEVLRTGKGLDQRRIELARAGLAEALRAHFLGRAEEARKHTSRAHMHLDHALEDTVPRQIGGRRG